MSKQLYRDFEAYKMARRDFVTMVSQAAMKPDNVPALIELNVLSLLRPLLLDNVPTIQETAALAISRLARVSEKNSEKIISTGMMHEIVGGLKSKDDRYQKNLCNVIKNVAKHTPNLAKEVVGSGCIEPLIKCLEGSKEAPTSNQVIGAAASSLKAIASHNAELAQEVVGASALAPLIKTLERNDNALRRVSVSAIGSIAVHSPTLAQSCIEARAISTIAPFLTSNDNKLLQQCCLTLSAIASHSVDTAELVVEADVFPGALKFLYDDDADLRKAAAQLVLDIVKHTQELSKVVVGFGGCQALSHYLKFSEKDPIPAVKAIGCIASFSPALATSLLESGAGSECLGVFAFSKNITCKEEAARAIGMLGKHNSSTSSALSSMNALSLLLQAYDDPDGNENLRNATKESMKLIIENCEELTALEPLITTSKGSILRKVLSRIIALLSKNPKVRAPFVQSGGFRAVQMLQVEDDEKLKELVDAINDCYPDQAVRAYSPEYAAELNKEVENYKP
jgi:hypothetical protein